MIKEANLPKQFSESSQMMLKLGRNTRWIEVLWSFKKKLMTSSLIRKYDIIIVILMLRQLKKWKVFIVSLFLNGLSQNLVKGIILGFWFQILTQKRSISSKSQRSTAKVLQVGLIWKSSGDPEEWYMYHWNRPSRSRDIWIQIKISEKNYEN